MRARAAAALLAAVLLLAGCGAQNTLSESQLRARATRICAMTRTRTNHIPTPAMPSEGERFLSRGIAVIGPELAALRRLRAPSGMHDDDVRALDASAKELAAMRSSLKGLKAGNDPLVAIKTLEQELAAPEAQANEAWSALGLTACQGT